MPRRGRVGLYDRHNEVRAARQAAMTPEQRQAAKVAQAVRAKVPVRCAPVIGDPESIDWEAHDCGYVPQLSRDGKPLPHSGPNAEPAWRWTEEPGTGGRSCLRGAVKNLVLEVYKVGFRHNPLELHSEGGFPDDMYWGRFGPKLIIREQKAMRHVWQRGQKQHLLSLREADLDVGVWFPCCLLSGRIDEELAALAGVKPKGTYARRRHGVPNRPLTWADVANGALNEAG